MGLHVGIYRDTSFSDCTNNGVTSEFREFKGLCLTNVDGPFKPDKDYPGAKLEKVTTRWGSHVRIVPDELQGKHSMMGGNYAATSDSRFREAIEKLLGHNFYGALPVHDRTETREQMNSYD
tara:strand:+ start:341 stop:703 length:363 start_codon:yes stop_codon:yes gene_type:complete